MEYYYHEGGAVYSHTIPIVGGVERMEEEENREGRNYGCREWGLWERFGGSGGGGNDAVGCAEDEVDVGKGEGEGWGVVSENLTREWAEGFLCGNGAEDSMD